MTLWSLHRRFAQARCNTILNEVVKFSFVGTCQDCALVGSFGPGDGGGMKPVAVAEARGHQVTLGLGKETEGGQTRELAPCCVPRRRSRVATRRTHPRRRPPTVRRHGKSVRARPHWGSSARPRRSARTSLLPRGPGRSPGE